MSVQVNQICKTYANRQVLDHLNFEIYEGEVVGLLGLNGAGKSTLMKILAGYTPPTSGSANVFGYPVNGTNKEFKNIIGYLPEHNPLYLEMYILEYLEFCANLHNTPKSRIDEVIHIVDLENELSKKIKKLSKGYRQRVGIAATIIHEPKFLVLDEPTSGLDFNQLTTIRSLIKNIGKHCTILLSSHIMEEIKEVCNRILVLKEGHIILDDNPKEIELSSIFQYINQPI